MTIFNFVLERPIYAGLVLLLAASVIQLMSLTIRLHRFMRGKNGKDLESAIQTIHERVGRLEGHAKETTAILTEVDTRLSRSLQGMAVERFDPFQNAGGQQSFATAFLSENGDGVVISGIHARDGVRVYAKKISQFSSERELSEEEKRAIDTAKKNIGA